MLDDGTYQYTWDAAGRLITVTDGVDSLGFRYDGDGNRLARIVNGTLTTHTLDVGLRLPEVLMAQGGDGATRYLHLLSGVATDDGTGWSYGLSDHLGSERQRVDAVGQVVSVNGYRPFGLPLAGDGGDPYGFTGEWWEDEARLLYLRARYYAPRTGIFLKPDPVPGNHLYVYVEGNPINLVDPFGKDGTPPPPNGQTPDPGLDALKTWLLSMPAGEAVWLFKGVYSKAGVARLCLFRETRQYPSDTVYDLVTDYVCEFGPEHRVFNADAHLTRQLARSYTIHRLRRDFYEGGGRYLEGRESFGLSELLIATIDTLMESDPAGYPIGLIDIPINITHFLGTFDYEILRAGDTVWFTIENETNLASGSRLPPELGGVPVEMEWKGTSVEEVLETHPWEYNLMPLWFIVQQFDIISILKPKRRDETGGFLGLEGGGTMQQTFKWAEQFFDCDLPPWPDIRDILKIENQFAG